MLQLTKLKKISDLELVLWWNDGVQTVIPSAARNPLWTYYAALCSA